MSKPDYERIYLVPEDGVWCWAETPAPGAGQSNADAVEYVRADLYQAQSTQVESLLDDRKEFVKKEFQHLKEIERLEIELKKRDEQNAALVAQVEALNSKNFELTCYRVDVLRCLKTIAFEHNHADVPLYQPMARQLMDSISANAELKEVRAEAGRDGYLQGHLDAAGDDVGEWSRKHSEYHAKQYADSIRQGGAA